MTDILTLLKERLADAEDDAQRLRNAIAVIERGDNGKPAQRRRRSSAAKSEPKAAKPVIPLGKIVSELRKHDDGIGTAALAQTLSGDQNQIRELLVENEGEAVRRSGQRRATRWHAITHDDRVAARAAEIEAQSKTARRAKAA